jgi:alpha-beta hydrolase superfamily lysophospholipase
MIILQGCSVREPPVAIEKNHLSSMNDSIHIFHTANRIRGVALVIHGLNLRPDKMGSIVSLLTAAGIEVLNLSLRGHGQNVGNESLSNRRKARMNAFKSVSYPLWAGEVFHAYRLARKTSDIQQVPLFLVGFSLGALLGCDLFASRPDVKFDRMVLFAPSLNASIAYGLKWLAPFPRLVIPSFSLPSYRANSGTPMAAYQALFDAIHHFNRNISSKINVPTIIFIDPLDEVVSYRKLKRMVESEKLDQWDFCLLKENRIGVKQPIHHLIVDEASLGSAGWKAVQNIIHRYLIY